MNPLEMVVRIKEISCPFPCSPASREIPDIKKHISENSHSEMLNMLHTLEVIIKIKYCKQIKLSKKVTFFDVSQKVKEQTYLLQINIHI